jgi:hypothetical protein
MENSSNPIGIRTCEMTACSAVPQAIAPPLTNPPPPESYNPKQRITETLVKGTNADEYYPTE